MTFAEASPTPETTELYRRFLADAPADFDPYYSREVVRFELRDGDVLVHAEDVTVSKAACGVRVASPRARADLSICGVSVDEASAVARAIDGQRNAGEVRIRAGVTETAWATLVKHGFGVVWFAPLAVAELDARVSGVEIVRFAGSPYEVVRPYWENMADVASFLEASVDSLPPSDDFVDWLRRLHVLSLVGSRGRSFYRPASPIARRADVEPGQLLLTPSVVERRPDGVRFMSGPRIGASPIGGAHHEALLLESLRTEGEGGTDPDGSMTPWGEIVLAQADRDASPALWFCPPRPMHPGHLDHIRGQLGAALELARLGDEAGTLASLARLHWAFIRLHPFPCGNQCVVMSLVNHVLRRLRGSGVPHLVLDHLALRLDESRYTAVFSRAVRAFTANAPSAVARTMDLSGRKRRLFAFLARLDAAGSLDAARQLAAEAPDEASLAFLR